MDIIKQLSEELSLKILKQFSTIVFNQVFYVAQQYLGKLQQGFGGGFVDILRPHFILLDRPQFYAGTPGKFFLRKLGIFTAFLQTSGKIFVADKAVDRFHKLFF